MGETPHRENRVSVEGFESSETNHTVEPGVKDGSKAAAKFPHTEVVFVDGEVFKSVVSFTHFCAPSETPGTTGGSRHREGGARKREKVGKEG